MNLKDRTVIFDLECDGFNPTKIHCVSANIYNKGVWILKSTSNPEEMKALFNWADVLVGHNIIRFDIPVVERLLGIKVSAKIVDTLALSWYLYPEGVDEKKKHGLEDWGEYFGIPKPKIDDWENLPIEEYIRRCEEDVKINCSLWDKQVKDLHTVYEDEEGEQKLIEYLMFKMDCAREAEKSKWKLDVERCVEALSRLEAEKEIKVEELSEAMPEVVKMKTVKKPDEMYLKGKVYKKPKSFKLRDGSLSVSAQRFIAACEQAGEDYKELDEVYLPSKELSSKAIKWLEAAQSQGLDETHEGDIEVEASREKGNPNSVHQIKDWLFDLGWKPKEFIESTSTGEQVPQVRIEDRGEKVLCPSVLKLIETEPSINSLKGLSVLTHRIGILKGFIESIDEGGYIKSEMNGFTNTLRLKHRTIVNLPSVDKPYGDIIRGVLISPDGYELCGSDMSSLENRTRDHFIYPYDSEYVKTMEDKNYDPHLAIAVQAGFMTEEDAEFYKWYKSSEEPKTKEQSKRFEILNFERQKGKTTNYACVYGAGAVKISETIEEPLEVGKALHKAYWNLNWSVKALANDMTVKFFYRDSGGNLTYKIYQGKDLLPQDSDSKSERRRKYNLTSKSESLWLWNPVSKLWYSLRFPKDIFSTLNQGTGVWCFDLWIKNFRLKRPQITGQFHDEVILCVKEGYRKLCSKLLREAIDDTNKQLQLNRELDIDIQYGKSYAEIH